MHPTLFYHGSQGFCGFTPGERRPCFSDRVYGFGARWLPLIRLAGSAPSPKGEGFECCDTSIHNGCFSGLLMLEAGSPIEYNKNSPWANTMATDLHR